MASKSSINFYSWFAFYLFIVHGYRIVVQSGTYSSQFNTDWLKLADDGGTNSKVVQYNCHIERYEGAQRGSAGSPRVPVLRLNMNFWTRLTSKTVESEVMGATGSMHTDFDRFTKDDLWRDSWNPWISGFALAAEKVVGVDRTQDGSPEFSMEQTGLIVRHSLSMALRMQPV